MSVEQDMKTQSRYELLKKELLLHPRVWLISGVAGFIGSNLLETLLKLNQRVVGLDNFATGHDRNLKEVRESVSAPEWGNFYFRNGDVRRIDDCRSAMHFPDSKSDGSGWRVDYVLHQAALGSVPRSLLDPIATNETNVSGFLNMLVSSRDAGVKSFTYAASSSTYGDHPALPKVEEYIGAPLSPYAVTKLVNELYAEIFNRSYDFKSIGLRYFNVFGKRQDPNGAYSAVIPRWVSLMIRGEPVDINGDGETSRDFCYIENVVQANILAACIDDESVKNNVFNVAFGDRTTLNELFYCLKKELSTLGINYLLEPKYGDFRSGDVRHSQASIEKAKSLMGYSPEFSFSSGIKETAAWYVDSLA